MDPGKDPPPEPAAWLDPGRGGRFQRKESEFRARIGDPAFPPESGRYHLYVQYACPWAHRSLLARSLLGLEDAVSVDVVSWKMEDDGSWRFDPAVPGATPDTCNGASSLQEVYRRADPGFAGIGTVPVLWDRDAATIVNNESREIVRMFATRLAPGAAADHGAGGQRASSTLLPEGMEHEVDAMIDANHGPLNDGVYRCGFARSQDAYDEAAEAMWRRLDALEAHLAGREWLCGEGTGVPTEADVCLWPTLVRFDAVYHTHFKCNRNLLREMPALWAYIRRFWRLPGVRQTLRGDHIIRHYYWSHKHLNPHRIVPAVRPIEEWLDA